MRLSALGRAQHTVIGHKTGQGDGIDVVFLDPICEICAVDIMDPDFAYGVGGTRRSEMSQKVSDGQSAGIQRTWIPPVSTSRRCETDTHLLLWQVRGTTDLVIEDEPLELRFGHAVWIPAGTGHEVTVQANAVMLPLFFAASQTATSLVASHCVTVDRELRTLLLAYMTTLYPVLQQHELHTFCG